MSRHRSAAGAIVVALVALVLVPSTPSSGDRVPAGSTVLLVVADAAALTVGDEVLKDHLRTGGGHEVVVASDEDAQDLTGVGLVVIAESSDPTHIGVGYRDAAVPAIVLEDGSWDEFRLGTGSASVTDATTVDIADASSPLAANLSGTVTVHTTASDQKTLAGMAPGVDLVATAPDGAPVVVTADTGATLTADTAPARRVGLGFPDATLARLTTGAFDIFDAAVLWALGELTSAPTRTALLVVGDPTAAQTIQSETSVRSRLRHLGYAVTLIDDDVLTAGDADAAGLVVMSKTVASATVGPELKATATPVVFWEDNQQAIEQDGLGMLATVDTSGVGHTSWHGPATHAHIDPSAPAALTAGLSGSVTFYESPAEMTYAPISDGGVFGAGVTRVAEYGAEGSGRWILYVYEAGATLADGTAAAGKRGYFGLYDPTFRELSLDGVALFDAMVAWAVPGPCPSSGSSHEQATRARIVVELRCALGLSTDVEPVEFSDVPHGAGYAADLSAIARAGITGGCRVDDGVPAFCPDDPVTRAQMARFLVRALDAHDELAAADGRFADVPADADYGPAAEWLGDRGITLGCATDPLRFCPGASLTHAQLGRLLDRAFDGV